MMSSLMGWTNLFGPESQVNPLWLQYSGAVLNPRFFGVNHSPKPPELPFGAEHHDLEVDYLISS